MEYLVDYASPETRAAGEKLIAAELAAGWQDGARLEGREIWTRPRSRADPRRRTSETCYF